MTKEEFKKKMEVEDWAPGWESIDSVFDALYPNQEPNHYATLMMSRSTFGGDEYLDGYSIYQSRQGYKHIVTYGMSELYANEEAFGGEYSKWGYEMTMKVVANEQDTYVWAMDVLSNLARYTFTQQRFFEPFQFIIGDGSSVCKDVDSQITAFMVINDTEANSIDTLYGKLDFIQLVGITQQELEALKVDRKLAKKLYELMCVDNPNMVTDLNRTISYL